MSDKPKVTITEKVLAYVRAHPGCTREQVMQAMWLIRPNHIARALHRLEEAGKIPAGHPAMDKSETTPGPERRIWAATIVPLERPEVFGGMWDTDRVYLTRNEAVVDVEAHAVERGLAPIAWSEVDEKLLIGRTHDDVASFAILVRSARLPEGI
jgi:hypothetical protein